MAVPFEDLIIGQTYSAVLAADPKATIRFTYTFIGLVDDNHPDINPDGKLAVFETPMGVPLKVHPRVYIFFNVNLPEKIEGRNVSLKGVEDPISYEEFNNGDECVMILDEEGKETNHIFKLQPYLTWVKSKDKFTNPLTGLNIKANQVQMFTYKAPTGGRRKTKAIKTKAKAKTKLRKTKRKA